MTQNSVSQAEHEAESARARLEQSLAELRTSISPGNIFDETLNYARNNGGTEFARNLGRQARDNPLPVALIGAGIAWLIMTRKTGDDRDIEQRYRAASGQFGEEVSETSGSAFAREASDLAGQAGSAFESARDRAASAFDSVTDTASRATRRMSDTASGTADSMRRGIHDARDRAADVSRKVRNGVSTIVEEQPLVLGAVGLAIGAAMAAAFPSTRVEDKIAGSFSDDMKNEIRNAASQTAESATNVATRAFDSAYREGERAARDEGLMAPSESASEDTSDRRGANEQSQLTQAGA